jgi:molecular chaperone HscB
MLDFSKNYFALFDLPEHYALDTADLAERYRELQRVVHPDRFANASEQERRLAVQGASHINQAFETLKQPLARARYMLSLRGIDLDAQQETTSDALFLMEQMELREQLAEARSQDDPFAVIDRVAARLGEQRRALIAAFPGQFDDGGQAGLDAARENVRKLQFLEKLREQAENLEAELEDL